MSTLQQQEGAIEVSRIPPRENIRTGKARKVTSSMRIRYASFPTSGGTIDASAGNFYSPELSTDFLERPQSMHEKWAFYRFFYKNEPFVGQAVDLHVELPLSKIRMGIRKPKDPKNRGLAVKALEMCEDWAERVGLMQRLIEIVHEYSLLGEVFLFLEDTNPEMPQEVRYKHVRTMNGETGELSEHLEEYEDANQRAYEWLLRNYRGWNAIRVLPPEQVHMESFTFTDERIFELIPDDETSKIIQRYLNDPHDRTAARIVESMPKDVVAAVMQGERLPLNTDPDAGSCVYYMARKRSQYEARGTSILERCLPILIYRDKLRQAQTQIASRHMTPIRLVFAEDMDIKDVDALREQVDLALQDPDYSIIANFEIRWEEMGADQRLLDLSGEYDLTDRQMYAGLGVTESMLSGESSYSGDRINIEVINTRYMLLREVLQDLIEKVFLAPMCKRMGYVEVVNGDVIPLTPTVSFTRLALRDNNDTFDALYNLYTKGSLPVDIILELLNIDPVLTKEKLEQDLFTVNDSSFNEILRGLYSDAGRQIVEQSNFAEELIRVLRESSPLKRLEHKPPSDAGSRF